MWQLLKVPVPKHVEYPQIDPVPEGVHRPFWSVMIPTYNCAHYLRKTLKSVLEQDLGPEEMQIEVVDDCSTKDDPEAVVREIGKGRVSFYRQPKNVGPTANFNTCIWRARGYWVHILHGDDMVMPGFYSTLQKAILKESAIGAAFCRWITIDENDLWLSISPLERRTPGILEGWIERIAVSQRIQCPAIVVKREVYERLGGFCNQLIHAADWEMWKRIAIHYKIWFEPQPLACYRLHSSSDSSRLIRSGANIEDTYQAIEISRLYMYRFMDKKAVDKLSAEAKRTYTLYALNTARRLLSKGDRSGAMAQIRAAVRCNPSLRTMIEIGRFLMHVSMCHFWRGILKPLFHEGESQ